MSDALRVLIVDDHSLFRRGLAEVLDEHGGFQVVGEADSGPEAVAMTKKLAPDVVLMDVHMPGGGGVAAVRNLKENTQTRIIMLTVSEKDEDLLSALEAGADAYLLKNLESDQLFQAIFRVAEGQSVLAPEITQQLMQAAVSAKFGPGGKLSLSRREKEVLQSLSEGATTAEIAQNLVISPNTVKTHVNKILRKLGANNRAEAIAKAMSLGLME